ncbi:hypothetical protein HanRHA438_Chr13g0606261 [Helianthus annuus]|nr:hypothetical protein HanRHA438_Chr13g0606261 [Helianthus annuus]
MFPCCTFLEDSGDRCSNLCQAFGCIVFLGWSHPKSGSPCHHSSCTFFEVLLDSVTVLKKDTLTLSKCRCFRNANINDFS